MNFYRLNAELSALIRTIEEDGELTPEQLAAVESLDEKNPKVFENLCSCIKELTARAGVNRGEASWFNAAARKQEAGIDRLKELLLQRMQTLKLDSTQTERFTVSVQNGPPRLVVPADVKPEQLLDTEHAGYVETIHSLDREKIRRALKEGTPVPGGFELRQDPYVKISPR